MTTMSAWRDGSPLLSVIICVHNRAEMAARAVASLADGSADPGQFEVIVVDSASSERPDAAVALGRNRLAHFSAVRVEQPGLSIARNAGLDQAQGRFIAFLDDDAVAGPDWVQTLISCFTTLLPQPAVIGGPIEPEYEVPLPTWWPAQYSRMLSAIAQQPSGYRTVDRFDAFGANIAFDRAALEQAGRFSLSLGRVGNRLLGGEESLVIDRISLAGGKLYFCEAASVRHFVPKGRLTKRWLLDRLWGEGCTVAALHRLRGAPVPALKCAQEAVKLLGGLAEYAPASRLTMALAGRGAYARGLFAGIFASKAKIEPVAAREAAVAG